MQYLFNKTIDFENAKQYYDIAKQETKEDMKMLEKQMTYQDTYENTCTVYKDLISNYYVLIDSDGMTQATEESAATIIEIVRKNYDDRKAVVFADNSDFKTAIKRHAAVLLVSEEYFEASELIEMLKEAETESKEKRYVVAITLRGMAAYDINNYDKVVEGNDFIAPKVIEKFDTWEEAMNYIKENDDQGMECDDPWEQ